MRLTLRSFSIALLIGGFLLGSGCPPQAGQGGTGTENTGGSTTGGETGGGTTNGSVTANAGPDQTVEDGVTVTLAGNGSDSSGAEVTFLWTQVSGPTVTLSGAEQATATFVAPEQSTALTFNLQVTSADGQADDQVTITVKAAPVLFVANRAGNSITHYRAAATLNGNVAPQGRIAGTAAFNSPSSLVLDRNGGILVTNADGNSVAGFPNALTFTGATPDRLVKGAATLLAEPEGAAYDSAKDLLFVANFNSVPGAINVYTNASSTGFNGNIAPTRQILSNSLGIENPRAIVLASTDELYVVNAGANDVTVFANASTDSGTTNPSRTITSAAMTNHVLLDAFLDSSNRLFVVDSTLNRVLIFANAPALGINATPAGILIVPNAVTLTGVVVDASGTGYVSDSATTVNAIYIYDNIAARNGSVAPDRTLSGLNTQLASPWHMTVLQP